MNDVLLVLIGAVAVCGAFQGCATSLPITSKDRRMLPTVADVMPTAPEKARQTESFEKRRWPDGVEELAYTYRGRHDGLPILIHSVIHEYPTDDEAIDGRSQADIDHRHLFVSLEQRESETFIPAGPEAKTHLLFAGMQPVGLRFSTRVGTETFSLLFLAPPQFFNAHRTAEIVMQKLGLIESQQPEKRSFTQAH